MTAMVQGAGLSAYRNSLGAVRPLPRETERDLARRWRAGDARAGEQIIAACLPFVISIALEYRRWGVPLEDIVQQGNVGLLRAAKKFDPDKDTRLATYAAYWIRAEIREYVVRAFRVVRLGTTKAERKALRAFRTSKDADTAELSRVSGLSEERVERLLPILSGHEVSLDAGPGDAGRISDRIATGGPSPEDEVSRREESSQAEVAVAQALVTLSDRERFIVEKRMMTDDPPTLQELGEQLGVSKERVRQLEERAKDKLRSRLTHHAHV
ncbi:MAG: sigma-70 family RNA polymerase sigma factor [Myxococcales bacterium]|jgi:RNA polymerase sigma-32 factor|nr:sigma-70 family RNA polymerase sigma factor [Myxococcales bacterium]